MMTKDKVIKSIADFPEEFSVDELIERLIFIEKVNTGVEQSKDGLVVSEDELNSEIAEWFK